MHCSFLPQLSKPSIAPSSCLGNAKPPGLAPGPPPDLALWLSSFFLHSLQIQSLALPLSNSLSDYSLLPRCENNSFFYNLRTSLGSFYPECRGIFYNYDNQCSLTDALITLWLCAGRSLCQECSSQPTPSLGKFLLTLQSWAPVAPPMCLMVGTQCISNALLDSPGRVP